MQVQHSAKAVVHGVGEDECQQEALDSQESGSGIGIGTGM